jgi:xylan 1,4-beta-xylosidase
VSPPKSMERWDGLMTHFAQHLVDRYGIDEVSQWYFEVWNEPNIDFWGGIPREQSYFDLYAHTARALKGVNPRIRVGGPATAAAAWVDIFLKYAADNHVPVDFVSSHAYADDTVQNLFGTNEEVPEDDRVCRAISKVRKQIQGSAMPRLPLFWTEWNVPGRMEVRDTIYVGPALANTIRECDGNVDMMSFWTFSDVFEEGGPIPKPFIGMFGLRAKGGINKPSYYAYSLLHQLGTERLSNSSDHVIVTKTKNGGIAIAAWNLVNIGEKGTTRSFTFSFAGLPQSVHATVQRVDSDHGNVLKEYAAMGSPLSPTPSEVDQLNRKTALPAPEPLRMLNNTLELQLSENALVLIMVQP